MTKWSSISFLMVGVMSGLSAGAFAQGQQRRVGELVLPAGTEVLFGSLRVAPEAGKMLYTILGQRQIGGGHLPKLTAFVFDMKTGETAELTQLVPGFPRGYDELGVDRSMDVTGAAISPDGKSVLLQMMPVADYSQVYVVDLVSFKVKRLNAGQPKAGAWVGTRVALSETRRGKFRRLRLLSLTGQESVELPVRGLILAGSCRGDRMVVAADREKPDEGLDASFPLATASILCIDTHGKTITDLGSADGITSIAAFSPSGTYLAFQTRSPIPADGEDATCSIVVLRSDGRGRRVMKGLPSRLIAVLDDGSVLAADLPHKTDAPGTEVMLCSPTGKKTSLGKFAAAELVGSTLYCITAGEKPVIRAITVPSVPIPPSRPAPTTRPAARTPSPTPTEFAAPTGPLGRERNGRGDETSAVSPEYESDSSIEIRKGEKFFVLAMLAAFAASIIVGVLIRCKSISLVLSLLFGVVTAILCIRYVGGPPALPGIVAYPLMCMGLNRLSASVRQRIHLWKHKADDAEMAPSDENGPKSGHIV